MSGRVLYCSDLSKRKVSRKEAAKLEGRIDGDRILRTFVCKHCGAHHISKEYILRGVWVNASKRGGSDALSRVRA
jgi:hypothetical protein